jgi:hypothetical protein
MTDVIVHGGSDPALLAGGFVAGAGVVPVAADDLGNVWVGAGLVGAFPY